LGLDIEAAQILADDAEDEQLTTPQDQHDGHQRRPTVNGDAGEVAVDRVAEEDHSDYCANETEVHGGAQGNDLEPGYGVDCKPQHLPYLVLGLPTEALVPLIGQWHLSEADPTHHAADEPIPLGHPVELVQRPAAHEPEIASVDGNFDVHKAVHQSIEQDR